MTHAATISMREEDWMSLVSSVEQGSCVLMLGPDAVAVTHEGKSIPVLIGLASFVKEKLGPGYEYLHATNPSAVAQVAVAKEDPFTLRGWVREFYEQVDTTSEILDMLATLPFRLVINTSAVLGVDQAFKRVKPGTYVDFYDRTAPARPNLPDPTVETPVVFNLYGSIEEPESLILSDTDRLDFLVSVVSDNPPLPAKLKSSLLDERRSFLFLGFRLDQWQLRVLLHVLANVRRQFKSFAVELERSLVDPETSLFYEMGHRIQFPDIDVETFVTELRARVRSRPSPTAGADGQPADGPVPGAPVVFLCHASEDKPWAERLGRGLRDNGISTWLDKENLRGGDRWDDLIRRTLNSDVHYVVVIQSANLLAKQIGYVNREITIALDRQLEYRAPRKFVLPVHVDGPDRLLPELAGLKSIDISSPSGLDDLVKAINRDLNIAGRQR